MNIVARLVHKKQTKKGAVQLNSKQNQEANNMQESLAQ